MSKVMTSTSRDRGPPRRRSVTDTLPTRLTLFSLKTDEEENVIPCTRVDS